MNAPAGLDLASIPERIQSEVQRAIQRSIKGVEYICLVGPVARLDAEGHPGRPRHHEPLSLPADGGRNLPRADPDRDGDHQPRLHPRHGAGPELHRVSAEARLRRLHAGLDRAEAGREKSLRMEDYVLDFIPDCVRRVQQDSGETRRHRDRLLLRRRAVAAVRLDLQRRADEEPDLLHHADRFPRDEAVLEFLRPALFRRRPAGRQRRQRAAGNDPVVVRDAAAGLARRQPGAVVGKHLERRIRQGLPDDGSLGAPTPCRWPASISAPSPRT